LLGEDYGGRRRLPELRRVFGVGEKRQIARTGVFNPGHAVDLDLAVPLEPAPETRGNLLQLQGPQYMPPRGLTLQLPTSNFQLPRVWFEPRALEVGSWRLGVDGVNTSRRNW